MRGQVLRPATGIPQAQNVFPCSSGSSSRPRRFTSTCSASNQVVPLELACGRFQNPSIPEAWTGASLFGFRWLLSGASGPEGLHRAWGLLKSQAPDNWPTLCTRSCSIAWPPCCRRALALRSDIHSLHLQCLPSIAMVLAGKRNGLYVEHI